MQNKKYYIKCERCGEQIVAADTVQKLNELLFKKLARNNHGTMEQKICDDAKEDISMDDARSAFASQYYQVYEATKYEEIPVEWEGA